MEKNEKYKECEIDWIEPPLTSAKWTANVGSNDRAIATKMGNKIEIIDAPTKEEMLAKARDYIDRLLAKR
jgi:hypothetical protein